VLWGVSHATSYSNISQGQSYNWAASNQASPCGAQTVAPEHDITICNGQMVESVNDNGGQTVLGTYPRQPFDFAGRTGTAEFDVSNNTQGEHAAWPTFAITDQPVPAPYDGGELSGLADTPRNSIGVNFDTGPCSPGGCGPNEPAGNFGSCFTATVWATSNYQPVNTSSSTDGCVLPSPGPGTNNHIEIRVAAGSVTVYESDPGRPASLRQVAHADFTVPLTRGLVWLEDVHYNGNKFNSQQTNTFTWDNLAFDGPVLPRDVGFDVLDGTSPGARAENGLPTANLGYPIHNGGGSVTLQIPNVRNTAGAAAALLELTYWPQSQETLFYQVNGHPAHSFPWPFGPNGATYESQTVAMPVPLAEVHDGTNTVTLTTSDTGNGVDTANYDLILAAAGGIAQP
jgi:hypothetical protein